MVTICPKLYSESLIPRPSSNFNALFPGMIQTEASIRSSPFNLQIERITSGARPTDDIIFNLTDQLIYKDQYNAHALYGFMETIATRQGVIQATHGMRPFVLSRSTYPGSGVYGAHWTGDNSATWEYLAASIVTMNNMAMFGISNDRC